MSSATKSAEENRQLEAANVQELTGGQVSAPYAVTLGGYAEAFYQWNFNNPSNKITNYRDFDGKHNSFVLANAVFDVQWDYHNVVGRVTLQVGQTPNAYYLFEPSRPGTPFVPENNGNNWKYLQQAYTGYRFHVSNGLLVQAGIFVSSVGVESIAVKDNWNWSNSNVFFGVPFYYTGVRSIYGLNDNWSLSFGVFNGWNSVNDNNKGKSIQLQSTYNHGTDTAWSLLYFGGKERDGGLLEGNPWRHAVDMYFTRDITEQLQVRGDFYAGFEPNDLGASWWIASALYFRAKLWRWIYLAMRGDVFREHRAYNGVNTASPIAFPVDWVSSLTGTLEIKPIDRVSFRLEIRHDQASGNLFFLGNVAGDGLAEPYVANSDEQTTMTLGLTSWF